MLEDDKWTLYCKSINAPCTPPDANAPVTVALFLCVSFGLMVAFTAIYHAITRLRTATPEEFQEANERLIASIPLLVTLHRKGLRQHCRAISRDLIQITGFADKRVSLCFHKYYSVLPRHAGRMASMIDFMRENRALRNDAVFITFLCFLPLLTRPMVRQTNATVIRYSTNWLTLFEQYSIEHPECEGHF